MSGQQLTEHRFIYPSNANRYVLQHDNRDGTCDVDIVYYDALRLINGRKKDAPRLLVEVIGADIIEYTDENGEVARDKDKHGVEYYVYGIHYKLGKVLMICSGTLLKHWQTFLPCKAMAFHGIGIIKQIDVCQKIISGNCFGRKVILDTPSFAFFDGRYFI